MSGKYLAGRYSVSASDSLQNLVDKVNAGAQSRVGVRIDSAALEQAVKTGGTAAVCFGEESYYWGHQSIATGGPYNYYSYSYDPGLYSIGGGSSQFVTNSQTLKDALATLGVNLSTLPPMTAEVDGGFENEAVSLAHDELNTARDELINNLTAANTRALGLISSPGTSHPLNHGLTNTADIENKVLAAGSLSGLGSALTGTITVSIPGLYGNGNTGWTDSYDVAQALGWSQVSITVTPAQGPTGAAAASYIETRLTAMTSWILDSGPLNPNTVKPVTEADLLATQQIGTKRVEGFLPEGREAVRLGGHADERDIFTAATLASAINHKLDSRFWALSGPDNMVYVFHKDGGDNNSLLACEAAGGNAASRRALEALWFEDVESGQMLAEGSSFSLGGQRWASLSPVQSKSLQGTQVWNLSLSGRDVGQERDLWIANQGELNTPGLEAGLIQGLNRASFIEIQNAADAAWAGAEIRSQSSAQEALDALSAAITRKDHHPQRHSQGRSGGHSEPPGKYHN